MLLPMLICCFCFTVVSFCSPRHSNIVQFSTLANLCTRKNVSRVRKVKWSSATCRALVPRTSEPKNWKKLKHLWRIEIRMKSIDDSRNQSIFTHSREQSGSQRAEFRGEARIERRGSQCHNKKKQQIKLLNVCKRILICLLSSPFFSFSESPLFVSLQHRSNNRFDC